MSPPGLEVPMGSLKKYGDVVQPFCQLKRTLIYVSMDINIYIYIGFQSASRLSSISIVNSEHFRFVYKIKQ